MFSRALTGSSPDFGKTVWKGIKILLKNGLFFVPKRHVKIEVELPPADFPYQGSRLEINKYMENWYNRYPEVGPEPVKLVSYAWWKREIPTVFIPKEPQKKVEQRPVSPYIQNEVFKELAALSQQPVEKMERSMHLSHDLGLDSLDVAELYVFLDERFEVNDLIPGDIRTVEDVLQAAAGYKKDREDEEARKESLSSSNKRVWPVEKERLVPEIAPGNSIQEVFLKSCDRHGQAIACADLLSGALSYKKVKIVALILSEKFRNLPADQVGVLLPSSIGAYLVVLAILLAGKVPVMLNWTSGVRALDHADALTHLSAVISSDRFLDRLENGDLGKIENKLLLLENVRSEISWKDKLKGAWLSSMSADKLLKKLSLDAIDPSQPAVILFTSGTETLPKGVPLSHENLLSNHRACMSSVALHADDILYSVLPPFHSFGISISGLLPLLAGVKVCFAPNPNDSHGIAQDISGWKPTLFFCAPSFIKALFRVAKPSSLESLRLLVSGAEKTPQELFNYVAEHLPRTRLLEGYGITECSPAVSFDRPDRPHKGVGLPIVGVEIKIIDSENERVLPTGQEGEICISGPNVFSGYLGGKPDPFILLDGQCFYRSGDRGMLDEDGALILAGRMKRFVKIGGEMVSLAGLEEELLNIAREKKWASVDQEGPPLAISVKEKDTEKPIIILFTTFAIGKDDVNAILKDYGYGRIVKIGEVRKVDHIPLTGTGKTHYRLLDEMTTS
jgi:long-chain-fatty-acid--[acyl-carrier-protein] ligase